MRGVLGATVVTLALGLSACSQQAEDPRVGFCRGLASDLSGVPVEQWRHTGNRIVEPEYAEVVVGTEGREAACFYAYDAVEPGAMEHATPLLAYATLPYRVRIDGRVLEGEALTAAVRMQQQRWNEAMIEKARRDVDEAVRRAGEAIDSALR